MAFIQFKVGTTITAGGKRFTITSALPDTAPGGEGFQELRGTIAGDPSFLAGKRTLFTRYLKPKGAKYSYDWSAN